MTMSNARTAAMVDEFNIKTGAHLARCVADGMVDLESAYTINISLEPSVAARPEDLEAAAVAANRDPSRITRSV
jgi:hypothetical protein